MQTSMFYASDELVACQMLCNTSNVNLLTVKQSASAIPVPVGGARLRSKLNSDNAAVVGACSDCDIQAAVDRARSDV